MGKIYENLTIDEIYQLEFQAGKKATEIIDRVMSDNKEIKEQVCSFTEEDNGKILQIGADGKIVALPTTEGITLDDTLTVADAAAEAKATGDAIKAVDDDVSQLKSALDDTDVVVNAISDIDENAITHPDTIWEQGTLGTIGANYTIIDQPSTTRIRSNYFEIPSNVEISFEVVDGYKYTFYPAKNGNELVSIYNATQWKTENESHETWGDATTLKVLIAKVDDSEISATDADKLTITFAKNIEMSKVLNNVVQALDDTGIYAITKSIHTGYISAQNTVSLYTVGGQHIVFNAKPNMNFRMIASNERNTNYCFLKSYTVPTGYGQSYDVCDGHGRVVVAQNAEITAVTPSDCKFILIAIRSDSGSHMPQLVELDSNNVTIEDGEQCIYEEGTILGSVLKTSSEIENLKRSISNVENITEEYNSFYTGELFQGNVDTNGNLGKSSQYYVSTVSAVAVPYQDVKVMISMPNGYEVNIYSGYVTGNMFITLGTQSGWLHDGDTYAFNTDGYNIYRLVFRKNAGNDAISTDAVKSMIETGEISILYKSCDGNTTQRNYAIEPYVKNILWGGEGHELVAMPVFTHLSDIHGDVVRARNFIEYSECINADAALISGDIVPMAGLYDKLEFIDDLINNQSGTVLFCMGNHDARGIGTETGQAELFDNIKTRFELTSPTNGTYYYKDFTGKKIRLISLNMYEAGQRTTNDWRWTQAQINWFISVLSSTPSDYGVIVMMHSPEKNMVAVPNYTKFVQSVSVPSYGNGTPITKIVDAFISRQTLEYSFQQETSTDAEIININADFTGINSGAEFICYVTGHRHNDCIGYTEGTENIQLNCNITLGYALEGFEYYPYYCDKISDLPRGGSGSTQDAFNLYAIDRINKTVRVARIGSNMKNDFTLRDYLIIPYAQT